MSDKKFYISQLCKDLKLSDKITCVDEQPFIYFARATSSVNQAKCIFLESAKYSNSIDEYTKMIITNHDVYEKLKDVKCGFCLVDNPREIFFLLMDKHEQAIQSELSPTLIGKNCTISPLAYVAEKGVVIGDGVSIGAFACIESNTIIGEGSVIGSGAKIGVQAFNLYDYHGERKRLFHGGKTVIGKNVLISDNTVVEQALYHYLSTEIEDNTKVDVNVIIGHNSHIGKNCEITGGSNIAGFVDMDDNVVVRLGVSIANGVHIGEKAHIGIGTVIVHNVKSNANMFGNPAKDLSRFKL